MRGPLASLARVACLACSVALGLPPRVAAQPELSPQLVQPAAGSLSGVSMPDATVLPHGHTVWGGHLNHARRPLRLACLEQGECSAADMELGTAVHSLSELGLSLSVGLFGQVEVGVAAAAGLVHAARDEDEWHDASWVAGLGDVRLSLKAPVLAGAGAPLELSVLGELTMPTGAQGDYLGARGWGIAPGLLAKARLGRLLASSQLAYDLRQAATFGGLELDDELRAALGLDVALGDSAGLVFETRLRAGIGGRTRDADEHPVESLAGIRVDLSRMLRLRVALGTGLWPSPQGYGTSDYRVLVMLRGLRSGASCALGPEDFDGYQDADGCADLDNDGDTIVDVRDACPNDAEDLDGFADADGCPDFDNDGDGVPDAQDRCPEQSEDRDGYEDGDGCYEPDNDSDGHLDVDDRCPMDPEDRDGYQDDDGCPEPGPQRLAVTVTDTRILVSDRVYFEYDSEVIRPVSMPTLDEVARAILALRNGRSVSVEGHTDAEGSPDYNLDLSFRRAKSVLEYLVSRGVQRGRLSHRGFGGQRPLAEGRSPEARALNRRVEFVVSPDSAPTQLENSQNSGD